MGLSFAASRPAGSMYDVRNGSEDYAHGAMDILGSMSFLWFVLVVIIALLLAKFVNGAVGGVVGLVLAILVFLLVINRA